MFDGLSPKAFWTRALVIGFGLFTAGGTVSGGREPDVPLDRYDCGVVALCTLLRLEGIPARLEDVSARLPKASSAGYSMAELRDAAQKYGVHLVGVKLSPELGRLDRPALVHRDQGEHGHFCVIRPVGHSGTMLQLIDSIGPAQIVNADSLSKSSTWTGMALVTVRRQFVCIKCVWGMTLLTIVAIAYASLRYFGYWPRYSNRNSALVQ